MNGPHAGGQGDDSMVTDYCVGTKAARAAVWRLAERHRVGFFDASVDDGAIWVPTPDGGFGRVPW
ncbi:MAG: hypothetical protein AAF628_13775 [Planctomycetota bacterium]